MRVIEARNVHDAYPKAIELLDKYGTFQSSRNGPVITAPWPVTTVYEKPLERVIFWPERDANPFLHLYESLWMLAGRNDLKPLIKYTKTFKKYSDDGKTLHDAYGYRWRYHFPTRCDAGVNGCDQLFVIITRLKENPDDRRCVLQMWDVSEDLGGKGKAHPCNLTATFQIDRGGRLNMVVFCRSNDIVWGCYGANAVHFSMLLEYMALKIECSVGTYTQVSVNWHAYPEVFSSQSVEPYPNTGVNPYENHIVGNVVIRRLVEPMPMPKYVDYAMQKILRMVDTDFSETHYSSSNGNWFGMVFNVLYAHHLWKVQPAPERFINPLKLLRSRYTYVDWTVAAIQWLERRYAKWEKKMMAT